MSALSDPPPGGVFPIGLYATVSITLVILNRFIFCDPFEGGMAIFTSWFQQAEAMGCILLFSKIFRCVPFCREFSCPTFDKATFLQVAPLSLCFTMMILLNNKCLECTSVIAYQIVRSLALPFSTLLMVIVFKEKASPRALFCCCGVVTGVVIQ
jgi:GDP-fucose transporter C1